MGTRDVTTPPAAGSSGSRDTRRSAAALTIAGLVVAAAVTVIMVVGYVPLPPMPSLADAPDPAVAGTIAYVHGSWERPCLATVEAGGSAPTEVVCGVAPPESLAWTIDGNLAVAAWDHMALAPDGITLTVIDPSTGDEVDHVALPGETRSWFPDRSDRADRGRLLVPVARDGVALIRVRDPEGATRELLRLEGPRDYSFVSAQWSPDGQWILGADTRGRLFVLAADGDPGPRLVAETDGRDTPQVAPAWWMDRQDQQLVDLKALLEEAEP